MELIIAELSRYIIVILFALYTFYSYRAFIGRAAGNNEGVFRAQRVLIVMLHLVCSAVILVEEKEIKYVVLWALELFFFLFFTKIYQVFYKGMSKLIWNNMMICMMIGFIMLGRLSYDYAIRQLVMASLALGVCLLVPLFIERFTIWEKIGWQYALAGVLLLLLVFVIGVEKYGARNWISIGGFELQPSEFVKIIYVFFIASLLAKRTDFKSVAVISIAAAVHVGILVLEKDLGAALIYFVTYDAVCGNDEIALSGGRSFCRDGGIRCGVSVICTCACACGGVAGPLVEHESGRLSDLPEFVCNRNRRIVWHGTWTGHAKECAGCGK